jgi:hypothetical protein
VYGFDGLGGGFRGAVDVDTTGLLGGTAFAIPEPTSCAKAAWAAYVRISEHASGNTKVTHELYPCHLSLLLVELLLLFLARLVQSPDESVHVPLVTESILMHSS